MGRNGLLSARTASDPRWSRRFRLIGLFAPFGGLGLATLDRIGMRAWPSVAVEDIPAAHLRPRRAGGLDRSAFAALASPMPPA